MAKIIAICGKICCGKTYYANQLKEKENAIILSCDELTKDLFDNDLGEKHDEMALRIWNYFKKKSVELVNAGCTVILDWGFWSLENRKDFTEFYRAKNIICEWHYIDVDDQTWHKNIEERNRRVLDGEGGSDYYLDEGLMEKLLSKWETPSEDEIDVWYALERKKENMELWDAYDADFNKLEGITLVRGEEASFSDDIFHLVCDILVRHVDGTYLLMQRDRRKHFGGMWEATAGGSALLGETPIVCAHRELEEETGIKASKLKEVGRVVDKDKHSVYVEYLCVTDWDKNEIRLQEGETIDYKWVTKSELLAMKEDELVTYRIWKFVEEFRL